MKTKKKIKEHITMCPYCRMIFDGNKFKKYKESIIVDCPHCKQLFDITVGDKFKSGEIKRRYPEKTIVYEDYGGKEIILHPEAEEYRKSGRIIENENP